MLFEFLLFASVVWIAHWLQWRGFFSKTKHPPSFYGVPFLGVVPHLIYSKNLVRLAEDVTKNYGPIFRFRLGTSDVVMVNGAANVKEVLKSDDFLGRPSLGFFNLLSKLLDAHPFTVMENEKWRVIRSSSVQSLRELGFGKTPIMEEKLQDEIKVFLDELASVDSVPYNPQETLLTSVSNNISILIFGNRLPYDHPQRKSLNQFIHSVSEGASFLTVLSFVPKLLELFSFLRVKKVTDLETRARGTKNIFNSEMKAHKENYVETDKRDFMDHLVSQQRSRPEFYNDRTSRGSCVAFFGAGSNTTRITLEYIMQLLAAHPQIQEQMYQEIIKEIGHSRLPLWADHPKLHLVNAVIAERLRIMPVAPFGVFRRALRDTKIQGYDMKKGTLLIYNIVSAQLDPNVFKNPREFNPARFLDADGKFVPHSDVLPFAIGKRACPGESFAVFQIFLYTAAVVQRFRIEPLSDSPVQLTEAASFFAEPISQKLKFISRS